MIKFITNCTRFLYFIDIHKLFLKHDFNIISFEILDHTYTIDVKHELIDSNYEMANSVLREYVLRITFNIKKLYSGFLNIVK